VADYYVCLWLCGSVCVRLTPQKNVAVAITVGGTVGTTVGTTVLYSTVPYFMSFQYGTVRFFTVPVPYCTENLEILERREAAPI
jgi:hypothetical protein